MRALSVIILARSFVVLSPGFPEESLTETTPRKVAQRRVLSSASHLHASGGMLNSARVMTRVTHESTFAQLLAFAFSFCAELQLSVLYVRPTYRKVRYVLYVNLACAHACESDVGRCKRARNSACVLAIW
jgi:hypothetical protein